MPNLVRVGYVVTGVGAFTTAMLSTSLNDHVVTSLLLVATILLFLAAYIDWMDEKAYEKEMVGVE